MSVVPKTILRKVFVPIITGVVLSALLWAADAADLDPTLFGEDLNGAATLIATAVFGAVAYFVPLSTARLKAYLETRGQTVVPLNSAAARAAGGAPQPDTGYRAGGPQEPTRHRDGL